MQRGVEHIYIYMSIVYSMSGQSSPVSRGDRQIARQTQSRRCGTMGSVCGHVMVREAENAEPARATPRKIHHVQYDGYTYVSGGLKELGRSYDSRIHTRHILDM